MRWRLRAVPSGEPRSLRRNFGATLIGNVTYAAAQFVILSTLAKVTSATEVGRYALALAIAGPIFVFASLKLRQVQATDASGTNCAGEFNGLRLVTSLTAFAVVVCIAIVGFTGQTMRTIMAVALFKLVESQIDILYGTMQRQEQMHFIARGQILRGLGGLIVFVAVITNTQRVDLATMALAGFTFTQYFVNAAQVRSLGASSRPEFPWRRLAELAWLAMPLGIAVTLGALIVNVPRYFLQVHYGIAEVGIYSALAYPLVATGLVAGALAQAASPRLANYYEAGRGAAFETTLKKLIRVGLGLGFAGIVASASVGKPFLAFAFGSEYADEYRVFVLLTVSASVQYATVFLGTAANAMRMFRVQLPITVCGVVSVALVASVAVPAWNLMGAAFALVCGQLVQAIWYVWLVRSQVLVRLRYADSERS